MEHGYEWGQLLFDPVRADGRCTMSFLMDHAVPLDEEELFEDAAVEKKARFDYVMRRLVRYSLIASWINCPVVEIVYNRRKWKHHHICFLEPETVAAILRH